MLHTLGGTVIVSSTVANDEHKPEHLVDGDLATAWNSRTNALAGSWITIELPTAVDLTSLKLTAGFTAIGPGGADWFSMNHRISRVRITVDGRELGEFNLDTENRNLQTIALATKGRLVRVEVADVIAGSKSNWREACVSEVELWGSPTTNVASKAMPTVRVDPAAARVCPEKARLIELVHARSFAAAKKATVEVASCNAGRFPKGAWYVTASVTTPTTSKEPFAYGDRSLFRGVLDEQGQFVVYKEYIDSDMHPTIWESVKLHDENGDGFDESIEELEGRGGVRYLKREVIAITAAEIKTTSTKRLGEYTPDRTFVPVDR